MTQELKSKNYETFPILIDLFKKRVFSMAYKFTDNYDEAQDLSQEIFLRIYKEIKNFRFESKLSTWIYRISVNMCIDWKNRNKKLKAINFTSIATNDNEERNFDIIDDSPSIDNKLIKMESQQQVHRAVSSLPDKYKIAIIMYHFNNMSYLEISKALDIPEKTVETRLYRGRRMLRDTLKELSTGGDCQWNVRKL